MNELIRDLARARKAEADLGLRLAEIEAQLANTELGQRLASVRELLKAARTSIADAETWVRNAALAIYAATDNKQPHSAVKIILFTTFDYDPAIALDYARQHIPEALKLDPDNVDLLDYARQHLPQALKLNTGAFEKTVKVLKLKFVTAGQEPQTRINKDLSGYLETTTPQDEPVQLP